MPSAQNNLHLPHGERFNLLLRIQATWALDCKPSTSRGHRWRNKITGHIFPHQRGVSLILSHPGMEKEAASSSTRGTVAQQSTALLEKDAMLALIL